MTTFAEVLEIFQDYLQSESCIEVLSDYVLAEQEYRMLKSGI